MKNFLNYVVAGYPLLWVETHEEYRAMVTFCKEMAEAKEKYQVYSWDRAAGIKALGITNGSLGSSMLKDLDIPADDPLVALNWLASKNVPPNSILLLKDFHHYVKNDVISRTIRNHIPMFKALGKVMVILSPTIDIPMEIEKEITVIQFKLPNRDELRIVLKSLCQGQDAPDYPKDEQPLLDAALGMTAFEAENAFSVSLVEKKCFDPAIIQREKASIVRKTGMLEVVETSSNLDDIGGLENLKDWILARRDCYTEKARKFKIKPPKGLLMVGIPGCGKSLTAKSVASALSRPLLKLDMGKVFGSLVGQSESNLRRCLAIAEAVAPCCVWIS